MDKTTRPRVLIISARSDIGGGPGHMYELASLGSTQVEFFAALPSDGHFYLKFKKLLGNGCLFEIPRQKFSPYQFIALAFFCRTNRINVIHSHGKGAGTYSRLLGLVLRLPVVHTLHGYHDGRYHWLGKKFYAAWESLASLATLRIICVSHSEASLFLKKTCIIQNKIIVIRNGTPIVEMLPTPAVSQKIVNVARFDYQKNLLEFINIARCMPTYQFTIIGDGEDRDCLENYIADFRVTNVTLHGSSLSVLSEIADAAVFLTTARWEGLPLAVLEAMSMGVPVVASNVVGNRDAVFEGDTGYLYPLGDIAACIAAINCATLLNRDSIQHFHRTHFSSKKMVEKILLVYFDCLKR